GLRAYLAVRGGIDVPAVLGSRATFTLGGFGGHEGRVLAPGDELRVGDEVSALRPSAVPPRCWPEIGRSWRVGVLEGPHTVGFFTEEDLHTLYAATWGVQ